MTDLLSFLEKWKNKVETEYETVDMGSIEYRRACLELLEDMIRDAEELSIKQVSRVEVNAKN